jgi:pimeloyl-ACP methyl ester carboxylesterase
MNPKDLMRYPPGTDLLSFKESPVGVEPQSIKVVAEDGFYSRGLLWSKGNERTVILIAHPKGDMTRHYLVPGFVNNGYGVIAHESRSPNNDSQFTYEAFLADIAAVMRFARKRFEKVVFMGYSGGGSAYMYYQAQAVTPPPGRYTHTPAGEPYDLNKFDMPAGDGMMFVGAHKGTGAMMLDEIDGSLVDESDPFSCDPALDMYDPDNGFREPPEKTTYTQEFLARYREAQRKRNARIDAIARGLIQTQREFRAMAQAPGFAALPLKSRRPIQRRAASLKFMQVFRTDANPSMLDLSIDPSLRTIGGIVTKRPDITNYSENGFARVVTPHAWLSQWSGLTCRSAVAMNIDKVTVPTVVVSFTGDNSIHPAIGKTTFATSPAKDKTYAESDCDHFGFPLPAKPYEGARGAPTSEKLVAWLRDRFATA